METINRLKWEINGLLIKEEKMWKQRFRALWLQEGDQTQNSFTIRPLIDTREIELKN